MLKIDKNLDKQKSNNEQDEHKDGDEWLEFRRVLFRSDSLKDDFSPSFDSCYQSADDSSDSPNIKISCRDSCCNVIKSVNTLNEGEENKKLIIQLINQIQNPELQKRIFG